MCGQAWGQCKLCAGRGSPAGAVAGDTVTFTMSLGVICLALGFSVFIGVAFGLYPANKAAKLQPIQALRHD